MTEPNWVTVVIGLGSGTFGSVVTAWGNRRASSASWERARLADAFVALDGAIEELTDAIVAARESYSTTPVGDYRAASAVIDKRLGRLIAALRTCQIMGARLASPQIFALLELKTTVFTPFSRPSGMPPVAYERLEAELAWFVARTTELMRYMRADLRLLSPRERMRFALYRRRHRHDVEPSRSLAATDDAEQLRSILRSFTILPLSGVPSRDESFRADATAFSAWQMPIGGLRREVSALAIARGDQLTLQVGTLDTLDPQMELTALKALVEWAESGLQSGPGSRDTPDGGRVVAWTPEDLAESARLSRSAPSP